MNYTCVELILASLLQHASICFSLHLSVVTMLVTTSCQARSPRSVFCGSASEG